MNYSFVALHAEYGLSASSCYAQEATSLALQWAAANKMESLRDLVHLVGSNIPTLSKCRAKSVQLLHSELAGASSCTCLTKSSDQSGQQWLGECCSRALPLTVLVHVGADMLLSIHCQPKPMLLCRLVWTCCCQPMLWSRCCSVLHACMLQSLLDSW